MGKQVVLIMTDTTRKDMVGCYGDKRMITPNIDNLADRGIKYERAYCTQPVCGPARSSIFTGLYPHSNGMVANSLPLGDNVKTIGQRLTDQGVPCAYVGKWHLDGGDYFGLGTCPEGWDEEYWYDMRCYLDEMNDEDRYKSRQYETSFDLPDKFTYGEKCTNKAIDYLKRHNSEEDFLLVVSYDEPHGPSLCPEPFNEMYDDFVKNPNLNLVDNLKNKPYYQKLWGASDLNKSMEEMQQMNIEEKMLLSCNSFIDTEIGKVLDKVYEKYPDALIIFTSDHGDAMGAHRLKGKGASIYDEICNVPLIISTAKKSKKTNISPVSHINIVPTILDWFSKPIPNILEGKSLYEQILGNVNNVQDEVFIEFTRYEVDHDGFGGLQMMRGIITENKKMAIHLLDTDELYDNIKDSNEIKNLINNKEYTNLRDDLHKKIIEHMNNTRDVYRGYQWENRPYNKVKDSWEVDGFTRQRDNIEYESRQLDYATGLEIKNLVRKK